VTDEPPHEGGSSASGPPPLRLDLAYDGTSFHGFAENDGVRTVAGELRRALETVTGVPVELTCAGRTDRGVHARAQVVTVRFPEGTPAPRRADDPTALRNSLVALLAPEIVVADVQPAAADFDARFSARSRTYRYQVWNAAVPSPFLDRTAWWVDEPLDLPAMDRAADALVGEHDFSTFCRRPRGAPEVSLVRRVLAAGWSRPEDDLLRFEISATAFCHQMVRSIVGLLVEVGRGRRDAADVTRALEARDRAALPTLAPPRGLVLWDVGY
jgi:tRNA pseudouridine38-40 synthase